MTHNLRARQWQPAVQQGIRSSSKSLSGSGRWSLLTSGQTIPLPPLSLPFSAPSSLSISLLSALGGTHAAGAPATPGASATLPTEAVGEVPPTPVRLPVGTRRKSRRLSPRRAAPRRRPTESSVPGIMTHQIKQHWALAWTPLSGSAPCDCAHAVWVEFQRLPWMPAATRDSCVIQSGLSLVSRASCCCQCLMMSLFLSDGSALCCRRCVASLEVRKTRSANVRPPLPHKLGPLPLIVAPLQLCKPNDAVDGGVTPQQDFTDQNYY